MQIKLMQLLKDMKVPLKAFSFILNWAAKSNERVHLFKVGCQPSLKKVIKNLYQRYNMNGLISKEKQLYLPYCKRTVLMVYFDASAVFALLLSCPTLNQDEYHHDLNYLFQIRCKVDWPKAWDLMIHSCFEAPNNPSIEPQWEKKYRNSVNPDVLVEEDQPSRTRATKKHWHSQSYAQL